MKGKWWMGRSIQRSKKKSRKKKGGDNRRKTRNDFQNGVGATPAESENMPGKSSYAKTKKKKKKLQDRRREKPQSAKGNEDNMNGHPLTNDYQGARKKGGLKPHKTRKKQGTRIIVRSELRITVGRGQLELTTGAGQKGGKTWLRKRKKKKKETTTPSKKTSRPSSRKYYGDGTGDGSHNGGIPW